MSEAKRVTLTTINSTVSSTLMTAGSSSTSRFGAEFLAPPNKPTAAAATSSAGGGGGVKGANKTLRLKVELFQTDSNKYPEFDYAKLLHLEKKKLKKLSKKSNGFSDPFEENDDDVARIAKELEKKYGSAYSSGRGKNKRDDVDIGLGYDESDSFIDNTEAYDEIIPDEVETIEGGFYINCGALEFKKLHTESMTTKTDEIIKMPNRPKKRVISSSSEESSSSDDEDDDDDDDDDSDDEGDGEDGGTGEETSVETNKSKPSSLTTTAISKKSKAPSISTTTANPAKKKAIALSENGSTIAKKNAKNPSGLSAGSSSNSPKPPTDEVATDSERERSIKKITSVKDMLKAQRDNYLKSRTTDVKSSNGENKEKLSEDEEDDDDDSSSSDDSDDDESAINSESNHSESKEQKDKKPVSSNEENQGNEKLRSTDTKLPDLDTDVLASVVEFREGAKLKNLIGKKFQFDDHLSESFLKIDDSLLCIDKTDRNMVFAHFEFHLSLPKYYFLRKAKQLRIKEEKLKSKRAFSKLHKAVTETMPAVIASYDAELRRYTELQAVNGNSEQPPKMPKKKFPWNTNLRNLLYDVYQVRWTSYPVLGTRKETLEEFITSYMSKKVAEIWPKGWMRYEELQKEIEKRKTAAKKAKEKGKAQTATPALNTAQPVLNMPGAGSSTSQNPPQNIGTYNKQIEELSARSNANSDTDSVASSSTSSGLKRKHTDAAGIKQGKSKAAKSNGEQKKSNSTNAKNIKLADSAISHNKKSDHSINHIISPTSAAAAVTATSMAQTAATSIFSSTLAALSQPLKHSSNTHIIDLDYYTNASDILQTTKQIQQQVAAGNAAFSQFSISNVTSLNSGMTTTSSTRRESSGDSEIEIVGVFPAKAPAKKQKTNSRSATPNSNQTGLEKTNNNNRNTKKPPSVAAPGAMKLIGVDVNKLVNNFIDLRDDIQVKPILTTTAKSSAHQSSSSTSGPSNTPHQ